jgi:hypothetical protein
MHLGKMIKPNFKVNEIMKGVEAKIKKLEKALLLRFQLAGERFVKNARENANFKDRTGNLRSSIGYVVLINGESIAEDFKSGVGGSKSRAIAKKAAAKFPAGVVLIVVAGMEYAAAVESKGFDVLTSSALITKDELTKAIKEISEKIPKMQ